LEVLDRDLKPSEFPWFAVGSSQSYSMGPSRVAWPAISADTAKDWMNQMEAQRYTRVDYVTKPSRSVQISTHTKWLMRDGTLAPDVAFHRTLGGVYLEAGRRLVPRKHLPKEIGARLSTIEVLRRHRARNTYDTGHRAALRELVQTLAAMPEDAADFQDAMTEMAWASENARSGDSR
jgi:hypothetical protein